MAQKKGRKWIEVLIVAKCIVNKILKQWEIQPEQVLIVAKCIVNHLLPFFLFYQFFVLIVAKCIVNEAREDWGKVIGIGINSSKVYCK